MRWTRRWSATLAVAGLAGLGLGVPVVTHSATAATTAVSEPPAVPDIPCDPGAHPERTQGRVTAAEVADGYAAKGYTCNTRLISQYSTVGGYRVQR